MTATTLLTPEDIRAALKCSRSTAYAHMRRALGRGPGEGGLLRIHPDVWEQYARTLWGNSSETKAAPRSTRRPATRGQPRLRLIVDNDTSAGGIRPTQPRTKKKRVS